MRQTSASVADTLTVVMTHESDHGWGGGFIWFLNTVLKYVFPIIPWYI